MSVLYSETLSHTHEKRVINFFFYFAKRFLTAVTHKITALLVAFEFEREIKKMIYLKYKQSKHPLFTYTGCSDAST